MKLDQGGSREIRQGSVQRGRQSRWCDLTEQSNDGRGMQGKGRARQCGSPLLAQAMKWASQWGTEHCLEFVNPSRADIV